MLKLIIKKFAPQSTLNLIYFFIMKAKPTRLLMLIAVLFTLNSCSTSSSDESDSSSSSSKEAMSFTYNSSELETMALINEYRVSIGLNALKEINHISYKSEEHDHYMIEKKVVSHDDFVSRSENIIQVLGAKNVGENIAYNYNSPQAVFDAWLLSPTHKANIEGNYTHFGLAIRVSEEGKKYYTNIFAKI